MANPHRRARTLALLLACASSACIAAAVVAALWSWGASWAAVAATAWLEHTQWPAHGAQLLLAIAATDLLAVAAVWSGRALLGLQVRGSPSRTTGVPTGTARVLLIALYAAGVLLWLAAAVLGLALAYGALRNYTMLLAGCLVVAIAAVSHPWAVIGPPAPDEQDPQHALTV